MAEVRPPVALCPDYSIGRTELSQGSSLINLSYISLAQDVPAKELTSYTLAAFSIGNKVFAEFGASQDGRLTRGNSVNDGAPMVTFNLLTLVLDWLDAGSS
ncbi:hypothetical protein K402DRAFT_452408 [Aulographum hederae CBS 113979]|uniref:Uncharacterized protein n=1 Tax=Aulographum hederae CBS 113979 TaxID=1176131 RepID=A0A6G1H823_9PEZI|nr:hypothetical protein K402DRAFT_452408 [Aulographum hederae CBS 113979]